MLFACTLVAAMIWQAFYHGNATVTAQKWLQFASVTGMFLLPPLVCGAIWDRERKPLRWLEMDHGAHGSLFAMAVGIMLVALPAVNLLAEWNRLIPLPDDWIAEEKALEMTLKVWLRPDNAAVVLVNIGLMAVLPALAEEMTFRGTLQQIIAKDEKRTAKVHMAIWISAVVFSAIHMQFSGFIPRMMMGALFGYMFVWTRTLWIPITMHFTNNLIAILVQSLWPENSTADTLGAGSTAWVGAVSLVLTSLGLLIFYRRTHRQ